MVDLALLFDFLYIVVLNYDSFVLQLWVIASYCTRLCPKKKLDLGLVLARHPVIYRCILC